MPVAAEVGDSVPVAVVLAPAGLAVTSAGCSGTVSSMVGVACVVDPVGDVGVDWPAEAGGQQTTHFCLREDITIAFKLLTSDRMSTAAAGCGC